MSCSIYMNKLKCLRNRLLRKNVTLKPFAKKMAARFSIGDVLDFAGDVLDFAGLSDSDSSGEEGNEVSAYRGKPTVDTKEVAALAGAVSRKLDGTAGTCSSCSEFEAFSGGEEMEDDLQGENTH